MQCKALIVGWNDHSSVLKATVKRRVFSLRLKTCNELAPRMYADKLFLFEHYFIVFAFMCTCTSCYWWKQNIQVFIRKMRFYYVLETLINPSARYLSIMHLMKLIPSATNILQTLVTFTNALGHLSLELFS